MDCCDWTGTGIFRSAAAATGVLRVENIAALRTLRASDNDDGLLVFVESLHDAFEFQQTRSAADDGITIVFQNAGPGQWARLGWKSQRWARQASWFIHPTLGNDENEGSIGTAPLKTHAELRRRLNGQLLEQNVTVSLLDDFDEDVELSVGVAPRAHSLTYTGTAKTIASGTVATFQQFDPSVGHQTATLLSATGISDWSPFVTKRIRFTTGAAAGQVVWVAKAVSGQARLSAIQSLNLPAAGDHFVVESLSSVQDLRLQAKGAFALFISVFVQDFELGDPTDSSGEHGVAIQSGNSVGVIRQCRANSLTISCDNAEFDNCCFVSPSSGNTFNGTAIRLRAGVAAGVINAMSPVRFTLSGHLLLQGSGGGAPVLNKIYTTVFTEDGVAAFDHAGPVFPLNVPATVQAFGAIWGQDNLSSIVNANSGTIFAYAGFGKPTALTALAHPVSVGGVDKLYSELPFFNSANGAGVVQF